MTTIPAGVIKPRHVRPLTAEERARLRKPATAAQLNELASIIGRRRLDGAPTSQPTARRSTSNNGWTR